MELIIKTSDIEYNFIKDRINSVEKHVSDISSKLSSYINKLASLRDCGDEVAKSISNFASKEKYNQTLRLSLGEFSDVLFAIQEYRDAQIQRTQVKVIQEFEGIPPLCKKSKVNIKKCFDSRVKELKKKSDLEKARSKTPSNWQKISQAEKEVSQAREEAIKSSQDLGRLVEWFERKKLEDLKNAFLEFIKIQMIFHAKGLELYSKAYNILKEFKVEEDLNEFNSYFIDRMATIDVDVSSPSKIATSSKVLDANSDNPAHLLHTPETSKSIQGNPKSIFTLKNQMAVADKSGSSSDSSIDPTDLN